MLSPVRDVAGWFSDTLDAKSQRDQLQQQGQQADRRSSPSAQEASSRTASCASRSGSTTRWASTSYHAVAAHVIGRDPTLWYQTIEVDKGSDDGVHVDDPVIGDGALVGKVTTVDPTVSVVTLITDHSIAVAAAGPGLERRHRRARARRRQPQPAAVQDLPQTGPSSEAVASRSSPPASSPARWTRCTRRGSRSARSPNASENKLLNNGQVQVTPAGRPAPPRRRPDPDQARTAGTERAQVP